MPLWIASGLPNWLVLRTRDYVNRHQPKAVMVALTLAILIRGPKLGGGAIRDSDTYSQAIDDRSPILPMMFTLIVCGTTSGCHGLVSTGIASKQLNKMSDSRVIRYSGVVGESMLSTLVIVLVCSLGTWPTQYVTGMNWTGFLTAGGVFLEELGLEPRFARTIMNVLVVSFAGTTLDPGIRIQRILVGELGKTVEPVAPPVHRVSQNMIFQIVVSAVPSVYIANSRSIDALWNLFGATNQLTACVSMLVAAVYALRFRKNDIKYALSLVVPIAWLLVMILL